MDDLNIYAGSSEYRKELTRKMEEGLAKTREIICSKVKIYKPGTKEFERIAKTITPIKDIQCSKESYRYSDKGFKKGNRK